MPRSPEAWQCRQFISKTSKPTPRSTKQRTYRTFGASLWERGRAPWHKRVGRWAGFKVGAGSGGVLGGGCKNATLPQTHHLPAPRSTPLGHCRAYQHRLHSHSHVLNATVLQQLGTSNADNLFLKAQSHACTRKYQSAHWLGLCGAPPPPHAHFPATTQTSAAHLHNTQKCVQPDVPTGKPTPPSWWTPPPLLPPK